MKEALTFYLPFERNAITPPEVTLVVRRKAEDRWYAGLAVCSRRDQFRKIRGRGLAGSRMRRVQFGADAVPWLLQQIEQHLDRINEIRPLTVSAVTLQDLFKLAPWLEKMHVI